MHSGPPPCRSGKTRTYAYLDLTPLGRQTHITKFGLHDDYAS